MEKGRAIAICRSRLEKQMTKTDDKAPLVEPEGAAPPDKTEEKRMHLDDEHEKDDVEGGSNFGATSFAELDAAEEAIEAANEIRVKTGQFTELVDNVIMSPDVEDKAEAISDLAAEFGALAGAVMEDRKERWQPLTDAVVNAVEKQGEMKTEGGIKFPKSDFAFTPSANVSSWKLRLAEGRPGNITRAQLGAAAAAFSPGGFRSRPRLGRLIVKLALLMRTFRPASVKRLKGRSLSLSGKKKAVFIAGWLFTQTTLEIVTTLLKSFLKQATCVLPRWSMRVNCPILNCVYGTSLARNGAYQIS